VAGPNRGGQARDARRHADFERFRGSAHRHDRGEDILGLCGAALDQLEVEWRFARPNMISVARKEAVARLDAHVGPKY